MISSPVLMHRMQALPKPCAPGWPFLIALGFAWLVCLPLSVNALRKAGLAGNIALDARRAIRFLPESERQSARDGLAAQVAEAMHEVDEGDESYRRLVELKRQLSPEAGSGRT